LDPAAEEDIRLNEGEDDEYDLKKWEDQWEFVPILEAPTKETVTRTGIITTKESTLPQSRGISHGAMNIPADCKTPGQMLDLFLDAEICHIFVTETNKYVANSLKPCWQVKHNLTVPELKKYFGLTLFMGVCRLPDRKLYWSKDLFNIPFVQNSGMSRDRFLNIQRSLHWIDLTNMSPEERKANNKKDGFWAVASFLERLAANFRKYYQCGQLIDIDEMCIAFKGRHRCKCYNPNKPSKWHLKFFCLNDAVTGFRSNFFPYRGKDEGREADIAATVYPVKVLTAPAIYHDKGHVCATDKCATDNWYSSMDVAKLVQEEPRFFSHFLRSALTNSYICYRDVNQIPGLDLLAYQAEVIKEWVGGYTNEVIRDEEDQDGSDNDEFVPKKSRKMDKKRWIDAFKTRNTGKHTPRTVEHGARKKCVVCSKKSSHECSQCGVSVHIECWEKFHDEENPF